jgi:iron complex outermembrane recepter protein
MSQSNGAFAPARRALLASIAACAMCAPAFAQDAQLPPDPNQQPAPNPAGRPPAPQAAQPAPAPAADEGQEIVVSGIRETLQTSINQKKRETAIVDTLSTEEIGDLPALSVGQAIQTITGATTHREKGDASEIALRGLGPFLSNATFNGRDATNGSGDRSVNFNQFPSELVNNIKIYKSQQADLVEGGVAGTIDIGTLKPLAFGKRRIQAEIKGSYSPYGDRLYDRSPFGWRGTLSYVDQYDLGDLGELGIAVGVQRNKTSNPEETFAASSTWTACEAGVPNNNCDPYTREEYVTKPDTPFFLVPNSYTFRQISESDKRDAIFGALQWRPSDKLEINLDGQYSDRTFIERRNDLVFSEALRSLTNVEFDENGVLLHAEGQSSIESTPVRLERAEEYLGGGLNVKWRPTDRLTISADGSYSRTIRVELERQVRLRTDPLDANGVRTAINNQRIPYTYDLIGDNYAPTITVDPRFDLDNHLLFWDDARARRDESRRFNKIVAGRLDATYELDGFVKSIAAGVRLSELTFRDYDLRNEFNLNPARTEDLRINQLCATDFPQADFLSDAPGANIHHWATFDPICLMREYTGSEDPGLPAERRDVDNRDVTERTLAGYVMGNYESQLGSTPIRGNFGVRIVQTNVTSKGVRSGLEVIDNGDGTISLVSNNDFDTETIKAKSTEILPSINAIFEVQPNVLFRLAGYRAMSRPAPSALGAGRSIVTRTGDFTSVEEAIDRVTGGNPRLKPLMSWNADAAIEWYPNADTIAAATLYYKRFTGGFIPVVVEEQFVIDGESVTVPVTQIQNSDEKSRIYGLELTLANRFSWLPKPLDGFGGKISYNYADSNFKNYDKDLGNQIDAATGEVSEGIIPPANISGYSKHVLSAQLYYENGPFSAQAVYNYRSNYYQDFVGGNTQLRYVRANDTFDLRASFDITKNLQLRMEAVNIFNEPKVTDMPVHGSPRQYHFYGPRYFLGFRARM